MQNCFTMDEDSIKTEKTVFLWAWDQKEINLKNNRNEQTQKIYYLLDVNVR